MGLDWGEARLGVALSDDTGTLASPSGVVPNDDSVFATLARLAAEHDVAGVVVGLPLTLAGEEGQAAAAVRAFVATLASHVDVPVEVVDERLTTRAATQALRSAGVKPRKIKKAADAAAAALILQTYLDLRRRRAAGESSV